MLATHAPTGERLSPGKGPPPYEQASAKPSNESRYIVRYATRITVATTPTESTVACGRPPIQGRQVDPATRQANERPATWHRAERRRPRETAALTSRSHISAAPAHSRLVSDVYGPWTRRERGEMIAWQEPTWPK